jgi:hypothetical protein
MSSIPPIRLCLFDKTCNSVISQIAEFLMTFPTGEVLNFDILCNPTRLFLLCSPRIQLAETIQPVGWLVIRSYLFRVLYTSPPSPNGIWTDSVQNARNPSSPFGLS